MVSSKQLMESTSDSEMIQWWRERGHFVLVRGTPDDYTIVTQHIPRDRCEVWAKREQLTTYTILEPIEPEGVTVNSEAIS